MCIRDRRGTKRAETPKVVYGRQPEPEAAPDAGEQAGGAEKPWTKTTSDALDAKKAAFDELIRGEYKDLFGERVQALSLIHIYTGKTAAEG